MANPNTDDVIMAAIAQILPGYPTGNTRLSALNCPVFIQSTFALSEGKFPAVHISTGQQVHKTVTYAGYDGYVKILVDYYDRWDTQPNTIDTIRSNINTDLKQMMQNIQHNSSLTINGSVLATSIPTIELSKYEGEIDWKTVAGQMLVKRSMTLTVNILPYDV